MPAVVRVKRRIDEEPLGAFVLNGKKRRRVDNGACGAAEEEQGDVATGSEEISTVLKFAGTLEAQDNTATTQLARLTKEAAKELVQQKTRKPTVSPSERTERARQEMRQSSQEQRFRVVNCLRTTLGGPTQDCAEEMNSVNTGTDVLNENQQITIVDIEKQTSPEKDTASTCIIPNSVAQEQPQSNDSDSGYVYDLYLPENGEQAAEVDLMDDYYLSVCVYENLVNEERSNNVNHSSDEYDSEDSNQENYYTNDYPDEDAESNEDEEYVDVTELQHAVGWLKIVDDSSHDNTSGEDETNHYHDLHDHLDSCDVDHYGLTYARNKASILRRLQQKSIESLDREMDIKENDDGGSQTEHSDASDRYHSASENEEYYKSNT